MAGLRAALAVLLALAGPAAGQGTEATQILIIDNERLYLESRYGQQIRSEIEAAATALRAENERIVGALTEEEKSLTERRPTMTPEAFRAEAEDFDARVQDIRRARDAKENELQQARADGRVLFFDEARPIVGKLMIDRGAVVVLDSRSVFVAVRSADITDAAIAVIDDTLLNQTGSE